MRKGSTLPKFLRETMHVMLPLFEVMGIRIEPMASYLLENKIMCLTNMSTSL